MFCPQPVTHTVRPGDNLYQLSLYYNTTVRALLAQNPAVDPYNLQIGSQLSICPGENFVHNPNPPAIPDISLQCALIGKMRKAWEQHVYWTRMLLIGIAHRLGDQNATTARLLQNPKDIADIFAAYYNADTAKTIENLLTEHLQIGAALITALRDGKTAEADRLKTRRSRGSNPASATKNKQKTAQRGVFHREFRKN